MSKIEKQIVVVMVVILLGISVFAWNIVKLWTPVQEQIRQGGVKSVVNELWNGSNKSNR